MGAGPGSTSSRLFGEFCLLNELLLVGAVTIGWGLGVLAPTQPGRLGLIQLEPQGSDTWSRFFMGSITERLQSKKIIKKKNEFVLGKPGLSRVVLLGRRDLHMGSSKGTGVPSLFGVQMASKA